MVTEAMIVGRDWRRRQGPFYSVHEVAKVFFAMSSSWLRLKLNPDEDHPETWFVGRDGKRLKFWRRNPEKPDSARLFTLADIEPMAHSLYEFSSISRTRLAQVLRLVQVEADLFGLFEDPDEPDTSQGEETRPDGPADA